MSSTLVFEKFPSIEQFRTAIKVVRHDVDVRCGDMPHDYPTIPYIGTVKLHGTNGGIYFHDGKIRYMSHEHWIALGNDNSHFVHYMSQFEQGDSHDLTLKELVSQLNLRGYHNETAQKPTTFFGEWCGHLKQKGLDIHIQRKVGIAEVPAMFVIFRVRVGDRWVPFEDMKHIRIPEFRIFNIFDFKTYELDIDFNHPELVQNKLIEITNEVEAECPVAKYFGVSGIGEGVVWSQKDDPSISRSFKVKGLKHSVTKVKKLAEVDLEKMATVNEFVTAVITENRLQQGIEHLRMEHLDDTDMKSMGEFLRWVSGDVFKEERDRMMASGLVEKDVNRQAMTTARNWYMQRLKDSPL